MSPALAAGLPLAVAEQDYQLRGAKKNRAERLLASDMLIHAQKNRARRALAAFKRANNSCFGSSDRAAGRGRSQLVVSRCLSPCGEFGPQAWPLARGEPQGEHVRVRAFGRSQIQHR
jgi:hypothetical protein